MQIQENQMAWPRKRFTATVGLFGASLGIAAILISFISLGLANWAYKKYIKNNPKILKKFKL